jgi:hypothetical protein
MLMFITSLSFGQSKKEMMLEMNGQYNLDENGNVTFTKLIDSLGLTKDEIYLRVLPYFTYNYGNGKSVIQVNETGLIIAKGLYSPAHVGFNMLTYEIDTWHIIRIDIKESKLRIMLTLTQYDTKIIGGSTPPIYNTSNVKDNYPINEKGGNKTIYMKAFYFSTKRALQTIEKVEKSIKEGNTNSNELKNW